MSIDTPTRIATVATILAGALAWAPAASAQAPSSPPGTIAYVIAEYRLAAYETDELKECPQGYNGGRREYLAAAIPNFSSKKDLTYEETVLRFKAEGLLPQRFKEVLPYREASGPTAPGLDLDGKVGPEDFTSPEGSRGIDNQLFRAIGCIEGWRNIGTRAGLSKMRFQRNNYNRLLVEITGVESLQNDPDVVVNTYRGLQRLALDGTNTPIVGRTQRIDFKSGAVFMHTLQGRIVDGVLITDPGLVVVPYSPLSGKVQGRENEVLDARFHLKLRPDGAEGLIAGYFDVEDWYWQNRSRSEAIDRIVNPALYKALKRLADAYPAPDGSGNTAISGAIEVKFVQVHIQRSDRRDTVATAGATNTSGGIN